MADRFQLRNSGLIDLAQSLQHIPAFFGEVHGNLYKLPSSMRQTVGQHDFNPGSFGVFGERASHI
jgi:hypothetical protein